MSSRILVVDDTPANIQAKSKTIGDCCMAVGVVPVTPVLAPAATFPHCGT